MEAGVCESRNVARKEEVAEEKRERGRDIIKEEM